MLPDDRFKLLDGEKIVRDVALSIGNIIQNKTRALQVCDVTNISLKRQFNINVLYPTQLTLFQLLC